MPTPIIVMFEGTPATKTTPEQHEQSLQIERGESILLSWTTRDADGVELTDSESGSKVRLDANVPRREVTPGSETQHYTLVALSGSERSEAETVTVAVHDSDELVSTHAEVESPSDTDEGGDGGITSLIVYQGAHKSRSFSATDETPFASMKEPDKHFAFAPTIDEMKVAWTVDGETPAVTLELYRSGSDRPVWTRKLKPKKVQKLEMKWKGDFRKGDPLEPLAFPAGVMTAEHSPYLLKAIAAKSANKANQERWTYLDVRVQGLSLGWAADPEKFVPVGKGRRPRNLQTYSSLTDTTDANNLSGRVPAAHETKKVYLRTNLFFQGDSDLTGVTNAFFNRLQKLWGSGAHVPIMVSAKIRNAAGEAVDAPLALGKARFFWDYQDKSAPPAGAETNIKAFIDKVGKVLSDATVDAPKGTNAHVFYGGKRGPGARAVFPAYDGLAPVTLLPDVGDTAPAFPFKVTHCATRKWAAVSEAWASGALAGKSGVVFRPSRMAGDAYALNVFYMPGSEDDAVKVADAPDTLPAELRVSTGTFTVWHHVDVAQYVQLGVGATTVDVQWVVDRLAKQYVHLNYDDTKRIDGTAKFTEGMKAIYKSDGELRAKLANYVQCAIPITVNAKLPKTLIQFKPYSMWRDAWLGLNGNDLADTYVKTLAMENPKNAIGDEKYDWRDRSGTFPFMLAPRIDHTAQTDMPKQDGYVTVEFADPKGETRTYDVKFEDDKRITRAKNTGLEVNDKVEMAKLYIRCIEDVDTRIAPAKAGDPAIRVTLKGKTTGDGNKLRLTNIRAALDEIVEKFGSSDIANDSFFPYDNRGELGGVSKNAQSYRKNCAYEWSWNIIELVLQKQFPSTDGGLYMLQVGGTEVCNFNGPKAKAMYAPDDGKTLIIVLSPTAAAPTLAHEVGHAKFVNHTYVSQEPSDPLKLHQQDAAGGCVMKATGVGSTANFCGICMLRMRGWSIFEVTNPLTPTVTNVQKLKHDMGA